MPPLLIPLDAIRQPAFLYGPDGRIAGANDRAEALAGRPLLGCTAVDIITIFGNCHPDGTLFTPEELPLSRALAGEEALDVPTRVMAADGGTIHILATASPVRERDEIVGALVVWQDVSALEAALADQVRLRSESEGREDELTSVCSERDRDRQLLDTILGTLPFRVSLWGRDERLIWANEQFAAEHDMPRESLIGGTWQGLGGPLTVIEPLVRDLPDAILAGGRVTREVKIPGPAGPEWWACTFMPFGRGSLLVITEEITERRMAAAELGRLTRQIEAERDRLATILDAVPDAISIHDRDDRYVYVNPALTAAARATPQEILGRSWPERGLDLDRIAPLTAAVHEAFATGAPGTAIYEGPVDGAVRTYHALAVPLRDAAGAITQVLVSSRDVTHILETEAALRESEAKYRSLFDEDSTANFICSPDGRVIDCNRSFARMFGFASVEEARSSSITESYLSLDDRTVLLERIQTEGRVVNIERFRRRRDGTKIHVVENILGIFDSDGRLIRTQGSIIEDTQRYLAETTLRDYAERLERSNKDLERFADIASHDLQEPLRPMVSFSQLLQRRYRGKLDAEADEYLDFIVDGGIRMQSLILDLLAFSRVNTTRQELAPTDTAAVLAAVERSLDRQLREARVVLTHDPMPVVIADPVQLEQVFVNLVSNAVKFRQLGVPLRVHVGARRENGCWEFSVADNGIGIEAEYYDRIFEIFRRLHTHEAYPGTGIGLAIVKRIIDRHGGRTRVESSPGEGSTFFFTLPEA